MTFSKEELVKIHSLISQLDVLAMKTGITWTEWPRNAALEILPRIRQEISHA